MSYVVSGVDSKTGKSVTRLIAATTEEGARREADMQGIRVERLFASGSTQPAGPTPADQVASFERELEAALPYVYVTYALIGANMLVLVLMAMAGVNLMKPGVDDLVRWGARDGPAVAGGQWWRLFTSVFVHVGLQHLVYNMLAFAYVGPIMERLLGRCGFLLLYVLAGLGGGLLSLYINPLQVGAGASGAIFGVYAGLLALMLRKHAGIPARLASGLKRFVLIFVGVNLVYSLLPGVGWAAHLGGLFIGFCGGLLLAHPGGEGDPRGRMRRNVALSGAGALLLVAAGVVGMVAGDRGYANVGRLTSLVRQSNATMEQFRAAETRNRHDQLEDIDFAVMIERELLPQWHATHEALAQVSPVPNKLKGDVDGLTRYLQLREEAWQMLAAVKRDSVVQIKREKAQDERSSEAYMLTLHAADLRNWLETAAKQPVNDRLRDLLARFDDLHRRSEAVPYRSSDATTDALIERELLPAWRKLRQDFDAFGEPPGFLRRDFLGTSRSVRLYQEYWTLRVASRQQELRTERVRDMQKQADDAAWELRRTSWSGLAPAY